MNKKLFTAISLIFIFSIQKTFPIENDCFNLSQRAFQCVQELTTSEKFIGLDKEFICNQLNSIINNNTKIDDLPSSVLEVFEENMTWTIIKYLELEEARLVLVKSFNIPQEYSDDDFSPVIQDTFKNLHKSYNWAFKIKSNVLSEIEHKEIITTSNIEVAKNFLMSFQNVKFNSTPICLMKITQENKEAIIKPILSTYHPERCGICKKVGAVIWWSNPFSKCAHEHCFEFIKNIEKDLWNYINENFTYNKDKSFSHAVAIEAVSKACMGLTLFDFLQKHGDQKLKQLFDTVGKTAVTEYYFK